VSENGVRVEYEVHFKRDRRARKVVRQGPPPAPAPDAVPRIARLLALAWKWEGMVRRGEVKDYAEVARLSGLTKGRVTQVCSLTLLATDLQDSILDSPPQRVLPSEHALRSVLASVRWNDQRSG